MDIEIRDGDNVLRGGKFKEVWGFEESFQRAEIAVAARRGRFIYDRNLGSGLYEYTKGEEPLSYKQIESIVKTAVSCLENISAEVISFEKSGENTEILIELAEIDSGIREERMIVV